MKKEIADNFNLAGLCQWISQLISGFTPSSVEEKQILVAVEEPENIDDPECDLPYATTVSPKLTMFERMREYYNEIQSEVYCSSHEEYIRQEKVRGMADKYPNMPHAEQSALRAQLEAAVRSAVENQRAAGRDPLHIRAARLGLFDMQRHIENAPKELEAAKRELRIICGTKAFNPT